MTHGPKALRYPESTLSTLLPGERCADGGVPLRWSRSRRVPGTSREIGQGADVREAREARDPEIAGPPPTPTMLRGHDIGKHAMRSSESAVVRILAVVRGNWVVPAHWWEVPRVIGCCGREFTPRSVPWGFVHP